MSTTAQLPSRVERDWPIYAVGAALTLALFYLFHLGIENLFQRWGNQKELSHSYFIPLISLYMIWDRKAAIEKSLGASHWSGFVLLAFATFMVFLSKTTAIFLLEHMAIIVAVFGVSLLLGGISLTRLIMFPLAYLVFMIPPPFWIIAETSWLFQVWSSKLGVTMIRWFDVPVLLSGNVIELGNITLMVVEACSGLRYLFPFLSLGALAAYFYRGPIWARGIVLLSTVPITIVMNSFRIAITGVLSDRYGPSHTEGFLHFFEGWVVFVLCIILLLGVVVGISRLLGQKNVLATLGLPVCDPILPSAPWDRKRFITFMGAAALGVGVFATLIHTASREFQTPERERFSSLPLEFPGWQVRESALDVATEQTLGADDYIVLNMVSPEPVQEQYNLYVAYLDAQRDGRSWHSPRQCLPGGGWEFQVQEIVGKGADNPLGHAYNRIVMRQGETTYLVYYWYDQRGRTIADEIWMKVLLIWDVAVKRRSDGAMVRLMTPIDADETIEDADARLIEYRQGLAEFLPKYIPS